MESNPSSHPFWPLMLPGPLRAPESPSPSTSSSHLDSSCSHSPVLGPLSRLLSLPGLPTPLLLSPAAFPCCWGHKEPVSQLPLSQGKHNACPLSFGFPTLSGSFSSHLQCFYPGLDGGGVWGRAACGEGTGPTLETLTLPYWPLGSIPGSGRSPGGGNGSPLQYSCLGNPMDRGAWWAAVHGVAKSQT